MVEYAHGNEPRGTRPEEVDEGTLGISALGCTGTTDLAANEAVTPVDQDLAEVQGGESRGRDHQRLSRMLLVLRFRNHGVQDLRGLHRSQLVLWCQW